MFANQKGQIGGTAITLLISAIVVGVIAIIGTKVFLEVNTSTAASNVGAIPILDVFPTLLGALAILGVVGAFLYVIYFR